MTTCAFTSYAMLGAVICALLVYGSIITLCFVASLRLHRAVERENTALREQNWQLGRVAAREINR